MCLVELRSPWTSSAPFATTSAASSVRPARDRAVVTGSPTGATETSSAGGPGAAASSSRSTSSRRMSGAPSGPSARGCGSSMSRFLFFEGNPSEAGWMVATTEVSMPAREGGTWRSGGGSRRRSRHSSRGPRRGGPTWRSGGRWRGAAPSIDPSSERKGCRHRTKTEREYVLAM
ncbi:hypothetical protein NL676_038044 [Syzygium grande]|nr:hypothetical protein NL676_038044 [Syzygium grande]